VAVATALVPAGRDAREQLHHLLDAVAKNPSDVPRYAALEEVYDAWERADKARANAFTAMAHLSDTLHASIGDVRGHRRGVTDAPTPTPPGERRFWESS
jgi:hypothetical protein